MIRFLVILTAMAAVLRPDALRADEPKPAAPAPAATEAQVEGLLFFATSDDKAAVEGRTVVDPALLADTTARLAKTKAFSKFSRFHLIGRHNQKVFKEYESWVVPSQNLCLKMDSRGPADGGGINLHLQLWQDKKVLVKSDTVIRKDRPVFLGGPDWRGGRLIFVVVLK